MNTKAKKSIAIIGASGSMGSAIANSLAKGNYDLILVGREAHKLAALKAHIDAGGAEASVESNICSREGSWEADIIIIATPYDTEKAVAERIRDVATGKIVISISHPLQRGFSHALSSSPASAAEQLQRLLPYAKVVKAFSTITAADFNPAEKESANVETFVAGNNGDAVQTVCGLVKTMGFTPVIAGDLSVSRKLEQMPLVVM